MYIYGLQDLKDGRTTTAYGDPILAADALRKMGFVDNDGVWLRGDGRSFRIARLLLVTRPVRCPPFGRKRQFRMKRKVFKQGIAELYNRPALQRGRNK